MKIAISVERADALIPGIVATATRGLGCRPDKAHLDWLYLLRAYAAEEAFIRSRDPFAWARGPEPTRESVIEKHADRVKSRSVVLASGGRVFWLPHDGPMPDELVDFYLRSDVADWKRAQESMAMSPAERDAQTEDLLRQLRGEPGFAERSFGT